MPSERLPDTTETVRVTSLNRPDPAVRGGFSVIQDTGECIFVSGHLIAGYDLTPGMDVVVRVQDERSPNQPHRRAFKLAEDGTALADRQRPTSVEGQAAARAELQSLQSERDTLLHDAVAVDRQLKDAFLKYGRMGLRSPTMESILQDSVAAE